jgi:serine/threonine-protein kinase
MNPADPPTEIGAYRVERRLGRGGMGEVFLAVDERLGRRVAIKRVLQDGDPAARERFRREARAAARLNHSAVVQIYDVLQDEAGDAIVMEYAEGRTLRALLRDGLPPAELAVRLAREIAEGLAAAHAAGLVHRDLKAENVVVTPEEHAKILDFGLARPVEPEVGEERLTQRGALLGTYHAMSPEQATGAQVDARSDLFSLGVLLYEMLTGRSPFSGSSPLETLQRVAAYDPAPLSTVRPDLPARLTGLVERLLAKRREERPGSAREVARELGEISLAGVAGVQEGWGDRSTDAGTAGTALPPQGSWAPVRSSSSALRPLRGRAGRAGRFAVLGVFAVLLVLVLFFTRRLAVSPSVAEPLRVAVLPPEVPPQDPQLDLAASGVLVASLSALASLEGLAPLEPAQLAGAAGSPVAVARSVAAREVLAAKLESQGTMGARVTLRRIRGGDGSVLWAESFTVPTEARDLRLLADAVAVHLRRAYPDRRPREGTPTLLAQEVRDEDYAAFLQSKRRLDQGTLPVEPELAQLEGIVRGSPRFLEGHLLVAHAAQNLFLSTRDAAHLARGREAARAARALAPVDPRPLAAEVRLAVAAGQAAEARTLLAELERLIPGDPELLTLSGQVAELEGDQERALADLTEAARRVPSWANLYRLSDLEARANRVADARRHLEELLEHSPGNAWGMSRLGGLELLVGEPARAERIFLDQIALQPQRAHYNNLGLARSLLGRYGAAAEAYRKALELDPGHIVTTINLADAELALGRQAEARSLYSRVLDRLARSEAAGELSAPDRMIQAQCLAHLGRSREAVQATQRALRDGDQDPEILYQSSLVYALVGDRSSALVNAEAALDQGVERRWFTIPAFGALRNDPDLRALLARGAQ